MEALENSSRIDRMAAIEKHLRRVLIAWECRMCRIHQKNSYQTFAECRERVSVSSLASQYMNMWGNSKQTRSDKIRTFYRSWLRFMLAVEPLEDSNALKNVQNSQKLLPEVSPLETFS
jgi:hypothetical protein